MDDATGCACQENLPTFEEDRNPSGDGLLTTCQPLFQTYLRKFLTRTGEKSKVRLTFAQKTWHFLKVPLEDKIEKRVRRERRTEE
jgi:hypothetical protein